MRTTIPPIFLRIHRASEMDDHVANTLHPVLIAHRHAGNHVGVPRQSFCGAVHDDVKAHR